MIVKVYQSVCFLELLNLQLLIHSTSTSFFITLVVFLDYTIYNALSGYKYSVYAVFGRF
nr:MAG TPA: hypothetical protein [Caudoviricetes sp.]